jgi:hypothetical protein
VGRHWAAPRSTGGVIPIKNGESHLRSSAMAATRTTSGNAFLTSRLTAISECSPVRRPPLRFSELTGKHREDDFRLSIHGNFRRATRNSFSGARPSPRGPGFISDSWDSRPRGLLRLGHVHGHRAVRVLRCEARRRPARLLCFCPRQRSLLTYVIINNRAALLTSIAACLSAAARTLYPVLVKTDLRLCSRIYG